MLFQIDHRSSRLAAQLSELFCPLSLPLVLALISLGGLVRAVSYLEVDLILDCFPATKVDYLGNL